MDGVTMLSAIPGQVTTTQLTEITELDFRKSDTDDLDTTELDGFGSPEKNSNNNSRQGQGLDQGQELKTKSFVAAETSNSNDGSHQKLFAKFQEERDAVLEHLRKQLDLLFQHQAERMMQVRAEPTKVVPTSSRLSLTVPVRASTTHKRMRLSTDSRGPPMDKVPSVVSVIDTDADPDYQSEDCKSEDVRSASGAQVVQPRKEQSWNLSASMNSQKEAEALMFKSLVNKEVNINGFESGVQSALASMNISTASSWRDEKGKRFSDIEKQRRGMSIAYHTCDFEWLRLEELDEAEPRLHRFVKSSEFEACAALLLLSNIIFLGVQVEIQANCLRQDDLSVFKVINAIYCAAFLTEIALRGFVLRKQYLCGPGYGWSWFDIIVVMMQLLEIIISYTTKLDFGDGISVSFVGRLVRIARVARVVRVIRIMRFLRGFKVLIEAVYGTLQSCVWALSLLMIIIYVFSIIFAQFTADFLSKQVNPREDFHLLDFYFGNFTSSVFTLFKSIVGGIDWQACVNELRIIGSFFVGLFNIYIILMTFVVINVITGLFLQSAIEQAQSDQDHIIQLRLMEKQHYVDKLKALFQQLDSSCDGVISLPEFEAHLKEEKMQAFFAGLEIENTDAWTIFKLLDTDGGGSVDYTEFVDGCIRLKGAAKSIEIAQLMYHHRWIMNKVCEVADFLYTVLDPEGQRTSMPSECSSRHNLD